MSKTQIPTGGIADNAISEEHLDATAITGSTELAAEPATTDELLLSDAGTLKRMDFVHIMNRPAFHVYLSSNQSIGNASNTKVLWDSERFDSGGVFASNKFTVPSDGAGVYVFHYWGKMAQLDQDESLQIFLYKNGSEWNSQETRHKDLSPDTGGNEIHVHGSYIGDLAADDYIEVYVNHNEGASQNLMEESSGFLGFRLTGA